MDIDTCAIFFILAPAARAAPAKLTARRVFARSGRRGSAIAFGWLSWRRQSIPTEAKLVAI